MDKVTVITDPLSAGARCDVTITYDNGNETDTSAEPIAYDSSDPGRTRWVILRNAAPMENFRVDLSWANGSVTNPVKIRKIHLRGYFSANQ
jgi:hypothetical protein